MQLPEKLHDDEMTVLGAKYLHRTINQLIDYLAEKEGRLRHLEQMAYPTAYEIQTHADIRKIDHTPDRPLNQERE